MSILIRPLKALLMTVLAYLIDVCLMPYLKIGGVSASASLAMIAIITVSYGRKAGFCAGAVIGILMESMLASVHALYAIMYPVAAALCGQIVGDMTDRQRERRRTIDEKKRQDDLPALLRIPLGAALLSAIVNVVYLVYDYLTGVELSALNLGRALLIILLTTVLASILMLPVRFFLGIYGTRKERKAKRGEKV